MASILYAIDCFKRPFSLLLNQKPLLSTCLGTMVSLAIIGIMIDAIVNSGLIQKNNPNVIEKSGTLSETQTLIYGNELIPISFGLLTQTKSPVFDPSIFSFDLFLITTTGSNIIKNRVNSFPCASTQTSYSNPGNLRCITESQILLKGGNDNESIKLGIGLRICNSITDGINCKSENEIKAFLIDKTLIVNFPNFQYDVDNYDNPLKIITSFFSNPVNLQSKILTSINIKTAKLITDNGIISNNEYSKEFYQLDSTITSIGSLNDFMKNDNFDSSLMQTDFEVSKKTLAVTRRYQKFLELLAALSGIGNALIILGWLLSSLQVYTVYIGTVLNYLYVFHANPKKKKNKNYPEKNEEELDYEKENLETPDSKKKKVNFIEKNEETIELQKIEGLKTNDMLLLGELAEKENDIIKRGNNNQDEESRLKNNNLAQVHSMDKLISKNEEETKLDIEKYKIKEKDKDPKKIEMYVKYRQSQIKDEDNYGKINIGFIEHLFAIIKNIVCKKKLTAREKLILKCEEIFKEDIDLVIILKRLQELEKLKILLLSSEQRTLFNLMSRPLIYVEEEVINKKYTMQHELSNYYHYSRSVGLQKNPENLNNIIEVYRRMKEKNNKTELDIKILQFLSKDIHQFCQKFI